MGYALCIWGYAKIFVVFLCCWPTAFWNNRTSDLEWIHLCGRCRESPALSPNRSLKPRAGNIALIYHHHYYHYYHYYYHCHLVARKGPFQLRIFCNSTNWRPWYCRTLFDDISCKAPWAAETCVWANWGTLTLDVAISIWFEDPVVNMMDESKKGKSIKSAYDSTTFDVAVSINFDHRAGSATISPSGRDIALAS